MKDAEYARTVRKIRRLADKWIGMVGLGNWDIDLVYERAGIKAENNGDDVRQALMQCSARWEYQQASLTFDMVECFDVKDDDLEVNFVHELCHVFLNEMRELGAEGPDDLSPRNCTTHEERVATMVADALIWTDRRRRVPIEALARKSRKVELEKNFLVEKKRRLKKRTKGKS